MVMILLLLVLSLVLNSSLAIWPRTLSVLVYTSLARSGNAVDPGTIISISHAEDLHWSQESLTLRQKRGQVIYHNYTVYLDSDGQQRTRWLKRQFLPGAKERASLQRRGFYSWKDPKRGPIFVDGVRWLNSFQWLAKSQRGQYRFRVIPYCFEDVDSKVVLGDILNKAIDRWHIALGPRTGVRFMPNCQAMCGPIDTWGSDGFDEEGYPTAVLRMRSDKLGGGKAPLGRESNKVLRFDPSNFLGISDNDQNYYTPVSGLVHELGHVLGLLHEQSRPGAGKEINLHCDRIPGYDEIKEGLQEVNPDADVDEICENWDIAVGVSSIFDIIAYMPFPSVEGWGTESDGPLDRKSVMLYSSGQNNVLYWKDPNDETNEFPILANHFPSAGDVAAVKVMYPDYVPPEGWHWDGDQVVEDGSQANPPGNGPPAVPIKPSSLRASKIRPSVPIKPTALRASKMGPSVPAKPSALRASSSTTSRPLSQIVHDAFATTGQKSPIDTATLLETIED